MKENSSKRAIWVGAFIIVGLLFLVGGVLAVGNLRSTFTKKMSIYTVFDDVNGLQEGNNIWFSGVKIGTVKKIEFTGQSKVKVTLDIKVESQQYIRKDAKVKLSTDGLIGNKILIIYGGSPNVAQVEEGDVLANEKMLMTEDIMETFQKTNENVLALTQGLRDGEGTIGQLLKNDAVYRQIEATTLSLQDASANARAFMAQLNAYGAKLDDEGTLAHELVSDTTVFRSMAASIRELERIADTAGVAVNRLKSAATNRETPLGVILYDEKSGDHVKATIDNLETSSQLLNEDLEALKHSIFLRRYFKKQEKAKEKAKEEEKEKATP